MEPLLFTGCCAWIHLTIHSDDPLTHVLPAFPFYSEVMCSRSNLLSGRARIKSLAGSRAVGSTGSLAPVLSPSVFLLLSSSVRASASQTLGVHLTTTLHAGRAPICLLLFVYYLAVHFLPISELHTPPPRPLEALSPMNFM